jgi:hypothetical protein
MIDDMRIRNLADNTQSAYLQQIIAYAEHFHRSPDELGLEAIRAYQLYLTQTRRLSPSSVSVATGGSVANIHKVQRRTYQQAQLSC